VEIHLAPLCFGRRSGSDANVGYYDLGAGATFGIYTREIVPVLSPNFSRSTPRPMLLRGDQIWIGSVIEQSSSGDLAPLDANSPTRSN